MSAPPSPSGDPGRRREDAGLFAPLIALTLSLFVARLVAGGVLHLTEDEAYYRLWAQAPALGYYDHPPMIAWWIWLGVHLAGDSPLGVRLLPILAGVVPTGLVVDLARLAGASPRERVRAGIWYNSMILVAAGGFLAVPDAPAALFWSVSLWATFRALRVDGLLWWLLAGLAAGLACLSKYSALFLGLGILVWLLASQDGRRRLASPGPWLALVVASGVFSLNVGWNATHQWLTFAKQFGRVAPHTFAPRFFPELMVSQLLLLNPLLAVYLWRPGRGSNSVGGGGWPFLLTALPFVLYLALHSLHDRVQAHWPAPVYAGLAIAAAFGASRVGGFGRRLRWSVPVLGASVTALAASVCVLPTLGVRLPVDPLGPVRGWPAFARQLDGLRRTNGASWVGTMSYGLAAQLADEPLLSAPILQVSERARWRNGVSAGAPDVSKPGILVDLPRRIDMAALRRCFAHVQPIEPIVRGSDAPPLRGRLYAVILVSGPTRDLPQDGCGVAMP